MSQLPTLQEEIDRKAIDTLTWLTLAVSQEKITPQQFSTGVDVLFMAVSGLVHDKDFIHLIGEAQSLCSAQPKPAAVEVMQDLQTW